MAGDGPAHLARAFVDRPDRDGRALLLTDPLLRRRVVYLRWHASVPAPPEHLDAVLVSHLHDDHLDVPSLRALGAEVPLIVPRGAGSSRMLRSLRRDVRELAPGDSIALAGASIDAVPAVHDGRRHPLAAEAPAVGFVVQGTRRVHFAGDTELFDGMGAIADGGLEGAPEVRVSVLAPGERLEL